MTTELDLPEPEHPDEDAHGERPEPQTRRLSLGAAVLARASTRNTRAVERELRAFRAAHRALHLRNVRFLEAERALSAATAALARARPSLAPALERLAWALVARGEPRVNPFLRFGFSCPAELLGHRSREDAELCQNLAAAIRAAGETIEPALSDLERAARVLLDATSAEVRASAARGPVGRHLMDDAYDWDLAYYALKRRAARAEREGKAPGLHAHLFPART